MYLVKLAAETKTELVIPAKNVRIAAGSATGHVRTATEYAVSVSIFGCISHNWTKIPALFDKKVREIQITALFGSFLTDHAGNSKYPDFDKKYGQFPVIF